MLPHDDFYVQAFWNLSTTRSYGSGVGPIPWNRIVEYGERAGLTEALEGFVFIIRKMDSEYLKRVKASGEKTAPKLGPPPLAGRGGVGARSR